MLDVARAVKLNKPGSGPGFLFVSRLARRPHAERMHGAVRRFIPLISVEFGVGLARIDRHDDGVAYTGHMAAAGMSRARVPHDRQRRLLPAPRSSRRPSVVPASEEHLPDDASSPIRRTITDARRTYDRTRSASRDRQVRSREARRVVWRDRAAPKPRIEPGEKPGVGLAIPRLRAAGPAMNTAGAATWIGTLMWGNPTFSGSSVHEYGRRCDLDRNGDGRGRGRKRADGANSVAATPMRPTDRDRVFVFERRPIAITKTSDAS